MQREAYRAEGERTVATLVAELVACNATNKVLGDRLEAVNKELLATQARCVVCVGVCVVCVGVLCVCGCGCVLCVCVCAVCCVCACLCTCAVCL